MVTYVLGDIFRSPAAVLVNTVNTKGVMGKGLAKDFKAIYPDMFRRYQELCESGRLDVGKLFLYRSSNKWVLNFPTKKDWRHPSKVEYIEAGLRAFVEGYSRNNITSVAFPQLGCGHGELDWERQVQPLMEEYLSRLPIPVFIHLYRKDVFPREHSDLAASKRWLHGHPESLGFDVVWEDIRTALIDDNECEPVSGGALVKATVAHENGEDGLWFVGSRSFFIARDTLLDVWQHFRAGGFLLPSGLPDGQSTYAPELMALFARLPYVQQVEVARARSPSHEQFTAALQLVPRPVESPELFELNARVAANA